jgi:hypothetical protein
LTDGRARIGIGNCVESFPVPPLGDAGRLWYLSFFSSRLPREPGCSFSSTGEQLIIRGMAATLELVMSRFPFPPTPRFRPPAFIAAVATAPISATRLAVGGCRSYWRAGVRRY